MPSKDIRRVTLKRIPRQPVNGSGPTYIVLDMNGMADLNLNQRVVRVDDEVTHEEVGWLADQWQKNEQDEDRNLTQYTLKIKGS
jgi:hypothetical protein